ncbi:uncharacterized protein MYCFIDRAFT_81493 [Pseudocercospora fijiensis CIRAD86]|uniref:Uncharacterized protein n=1 Tax=Pseudocercospora fijiensis (strain CIRAD86) TaxID=383855 RepID=M3A9Y6_PSEFD|nr:uncharacterized protein MYCFIDRAFT_81493 [Pseudocercospora fijiensis CIRAD86]EME81441.1 hypothetical protein MYCFIDRAFT_81493 [Pseudocercospora fijiensis CIRAD86]
MKSVLALALALAATAAAFPAAGIKARQVADESLSFTGVAIRSGSDIQYAPIAASGTNFWLNKDTSTYTPDNIPVNTNATTSTVFTSSLDADTLALDVTVPGGQQVYVSADGALKYTVAHSGSTGEGSTLQGFGIVDGHLVFEGNDFLAVATNETSNIPDGKGTAYQIFAASRTELTGQGFAVRVIGFEGERAWEYA